MDIQLVNPLDDVVVFEVALNGEGCPSKISLDKSMSIRVCDPMYTKLRLRMACYYAPNTQFVSPGFRQTGEMAHFPFPYKTGILMIDNAIIIMSTMHDNFMDYGSIYRAQ